MPAALSRPLSRTLKGPSNPLGALRPDNWCTAPPGLPEASGQRRYEIAVFRADRSETPANPRGGRPGASCRPQQRLALTFPFTPYRRLAVDGVEDPFGQAVHRVRFVQMPQRRASHVVENHTPYGLYSFRVRHGKPSRSTFTRMHSNLASGRARAIKNHEMRTSALLA